jgi:hypothetical protein
VALKGGIAGWRKAGLPMITREAESMTQLADLCPDCKVPLSAHSH